MTTDQKVIGILAAIVAIAGAVVVGTGGATLPGFLRSTNPQAMCSSKEVEDTLHKLWVNALSGISVMSALGIPDSEPTGLTEQQIQSNSEYKVAWEKYNEANDHTPRDNDQVRMLLMEARRLRQIVIDDYKARHPVSPPDVTFESDPIAIHYDRDLQRVICQRRFTTTNGLMNMSMLVSGQNALTTNYSVQPGASGGYIVAILTTSED